MYTIASLQFDAEKWKLEPGGEVLLYSLSSHLPLRVSADGEVDACGQFNDKLGASLLTQSCDLFCSVLFRGGFRRVQHVRPNRGPHKGANLFFIFCNTVTSQKY